jgi:hypothetical protein
VSELQRHGKSSGQKISKTTKQHRGYTLGILQQKFCKGLSDLSWVHPRQYFALRGESVVDHDKLETDPEHVGDHDYVEHARVDGGDRVENKPEYDEDNYDVENGPQCDRDHDGEWWGPVDDGEWWGPDDVEDEPVEDDRAKDHETGHEEQLLMVDANPSGHIVIEVNHLIKPGKGTVVGLLQERAPWINAQPFSGKRSFARVRVNVAQEAAAFSAIKDIARDCGKRAEIKVVHRRFDSPRD